MRITTRTVSALAAAALCAAGAAGCSESGSGTKAEVPADYAAASATASMPPSMGMSSPAANHGMVSAKPVGAYGDVLVNHKDRTLYLFEADKADKSSCTGSCEKTWRPLIVKNKPEAGTGGVKAKLLGTTTRANGAKQVTYDGHPLYTYQGDHHPGEAHGQGKNEFGGKWYVVDVKGKAVTTPPPSPTHTPSHTPSHTASPGMSAGVTPSPSASY
ncbi:hypothetical protein [Streptomyces sp. NPDC093109]|uniref:COG4315 family predicted lipoprotein n=1 Tax=Streptomyces sp. NPDC093109 TaxID=3154977 RepID=UPI00344E8168